MAETDGAEHRQYRGGGGAAQRGQGLGAAGVGAEALELIQHHQIRLQCLQATVRQRGAQPGRQLEGFGALVTVQCTRPPTGVVQPSHPTHQPVAAAPAKAPAKTKKAASAPAEELANPFDEEEGAVAVAVASDEDGEPDWD